MSIQKTGHGAKLSVTGVADLTIKQRGIKPPAVDGGGATNLTTLENVKWKTKGEKVLLELGNLTLKVLYDLETYSTIIANCNKNKEMVLTLRSGKSITFWAQINKFDPDELGEDEPEATIEIIPSCRNDDDDETGPIIDIPA